MVNTRSQTTRSNSRRIRNPVNQYKNRKNVVVKKKVSFKETNCITHYHENNRIITIAFKFNRKEKQISYGATIYRNDGDVWDRKAHIETAKGRLEKCPVVLIDFNPDVGKFRTLLRKQLFTFGVHSSR